jgi:predicted RNA-binding protein associated with RNAse of E/G family
MDRGKAYTVPPLATSELSRLNVRMKSDNWKEKCIISAFEAKQYQLLNMFQHSGKHRSYYLQGGLRSPYKDLALGVLWEVSDVIG